MVLQVNPYQPYQVKVIPSLAPLQLQCLTQLYQPIMGGQALSLYLTLANQPLNHEDWTYRQVHAWLLPTLNMGIQDLNEARIRLEGVGLMRTYRDQASHDSYQRQTILYELQSPLAIEQFFNHPQLSIALYHQIGDEAFYKLNYHWKDEGIDQEKYQEISQTFTSVFNQKSLHHDFGDLVLVTKDVQYKEQYGYPDSNEDLASSSFNQTLYRQILETNGFDQELLNKAVIQQVVHLSQFYDLDEQTMAQVTQLAQNPISQQVDLDLLRDYAQKHQYFTKQRGQKHSRMEQAQTVDKDKLKALYPDLTDDEIELVGICQELDPEAFLSQMKLASNGFVSSSESFYLRDLRQQSSLKDDVINMLIYYLIGLERQANFERGRSNRIANQWQQAGIEDAGEALNFLLRQKKVKEKSPNQSNKNRGAWKKSIPKRQEALPSWMNGEGTQVDERVPVSPTNPESVHAIRQRLKALMNKEESEHEDHQASDE